MYVPPDAFVALSDVLNLKPFDKKSMYAAELDASATDKSGTSLKDAWLYVSLAVSNKYQFPAESERFHNTQRGLNPVYTNVPSLDPLPV
jgi:hypothetical protein